MLERVSRKKTARDAHDWAVVLQRAPEVASNRMTDEDPVLDDERLVQAVLVPKRLLLLGRLEVEVVADAADDGVLADFLLRVIRDDHRHRRR